MYLFDSDELIDSEIEFEFDFLFLELEFELSFDDISLSELEDDWKFKVNL